MHMCAHMHIFRWVFCFLSLEGNVTCKHFLEVLNYVLTLLTFVLGFSPKKKKEKEGFMCSPHEVTCANFSKFCYHYTLDISVPMSWCGVIIPEPVLK